MKEKCKRVCAIASVILIIYLIVPFVTYSIGAVTGFMDGWNEAAAEGTSSEPMWKIMLSLIISFAVLAINIVPIVTAIRLLLGVRKADSPFTELNGKRIGIIGICFMLMEPINFLYELINNEFEIGSGLAFSAGLVLYCISLIFRYGCELQQESDETL
ncbi:MAG: DUF2975 domain-containing protein [Oscillospiraceae bacterium]|nr:DUF2975 domain-containing protein [Oscillospiraceae bacterium]